MAYRRNPMSALMRSSPARARRYLSGPRYRRGAPIRRVAGTAKRRVRRSPIRRGKALARRLFRPSPAALFVAQRLNPFTSRGYGLSDGSGQRTTIVKSLMRFPVTARVENDVSRMRVRVMPACGFAPGEAYGDVCGPGDYWDSANGYSFYGGKVQVSNHFLNAPGTLGHLHSYNVDRFDDDVFATAQTQWDSYRPVALGVRVTNSSALQNRGGTLYMCQSYFRDPHSGQGTALNSETVNNNFRIFLAAAPTAEGQERYGLSPNHNFQPISAITGNDSVLVLDAASQSLNKNVVHWTPTGANDVHFANYTSRGPAHHFRDEEGNVQWDVFQKYFQESGIDIYYEGTEAQTFQVEVCTIYEVIPERSIEEHFRREVPEAEPQRVAQVNAALPVNVQGEEASNLAQQVVSGARRVFGQIAADVDEDMEMLGDVLRGEPIGKKSRMAYRVQ